MRDFPTSNQEPLVSVVVPAYNAERWIERTLATALHQTYSNLEVLVVDDGSSDRTAEIVDAIAAKESRLRLIRQANAGVAAARNRGIREAAGELIALLDADDLWHLSKLRKQVARFYEDRDTEQVGLVYCWSQSVNEQDCVIRSSLPRDVIEGEVFERLLDENFVGNGSSPMIRASALAAVGAYDEGMRIGCEDWELYLRIANRFQVGVVPLFLLGYRQVSGSMSKSFSKMIVAHEEMLERVHAYRPTLDRAQIRDSRTSLYFWLFVLSKPLSKPSFQLGVRALKNDPLVMIRARSWRRIGRILKSLYSSLGQNQLWTEREKFAGLSRLQDWQITRGLEQPLVSVTIPAYNAERWISRTLDSVLAQTHCNLEVIVVDDGSTDRTSEIILEYADRDARIRYFYQSNSGQSVARNYAIEQSSGRYIAPLDADDLWHTTKIEKQVACFRRSDLAGESLSLVYCWSLSIDESDYILSSIGKRQRIEGDVFASLLKDNFVANGSTPMIDTRYLAQTEGYAQSTTGCEDWLLYLRLAALGKYGLVPEHLVGYRQSSASTSKNVALMLESHQFLIDRIQEMHPEISDRAIRESRNAIHLWLLFNHKFYSPLFYRFLLHTLRVDAFVFFRKSTLRRFFNIIVGMPSLIKKRLGWASVQKFSG